MEEAKAQVFQVDGIAFQARQEPQLAWLQNYGRVFWVADGQMSGNLCFGVEGRYGRLFIKYAGERPVNYSGRPEAAAETLRNAMPLYQREHPALVKLLAHGPAGAGYAAVFRWEEAAVLRPTPPSRVVHDRVQRLQLSRSLRMLDMVYDLHAQLAGDGYIAVDFYDGNLLIDFDRNAAIVCDIDLYRKKPAVNDRGRMQGSSRFLSPEEYTLGAPLTESTTVYAMGALAFEFYGSNQDRSIHAWHGPRQLYDVAARATRDAPENRYPSLQAFLGAWREAVAHLWVY